MTTSKIIFYQTFPTEQFANQKLGIEIDIDVNDSILEVFQYAKKELQQTFEKLNQNLQSPNEKQQPPSEINVAHERIQIAIENANTTEELSLIKSDMEKTNDGNLYVQYMNKAKSLFFTESLNIP